MSAETHVRQDTLTLDSGEVGPHLYREPLLPAGSVTTALCGAVFRVRGGRAPKGFREWACPMCVTIWDSRRGQLR